MVEEVWTGNPIELSNLRIFGSLAYVHISSEDRSKLDPKSRRCIFIGYNNDVKGYKLWDPTKKKVVVSRDVIFDEQSMLNRSEVTDLLETKEGSTSTRDNIHLEIILPNYSTVSAGPIVEPGFDDEEEFPDKGGAQKYNLVRDRAP